MAKKLRRGSLRVLRIIPVLGSDVGLFEFVQPLQTAKETCMRKGARLLRTTFSRVAAHLTAAGLFAASLPAAAQVTFDVIGPHEYDLPVDFKPFNVFVQYADFQSTTQVWNGNGDKKNTQDTDLTVGLS